MRKVDAMPPLVEILSIFHQIFILSSAVFLFSSPANAAGPTNEAESIADLSSGRYPLAISPDGMWRVHVNEKNVLHREDISRKEPTREIPLSITVRALSVSQEARKVVVTDGHCVGLLFFDNSSNMPVSGVLSGESAIKWFGDEKKVCQNLNGDLPSPASRTYEAHSIAIAKSGKFIALQGYHVIKILDSDTGRIVSVIPVGGGHWLNPTVVLNMQFVDDDKKLFVVQAVLGEQWESEALGSDMQYAIWDLQKGELFNFYNTQTTGTLLSDDLHWSFSEQTGKLWAINTNGNAWEDKQRAPIRPYAINLKECGNKSIHQQLTLPHTDWIDMSSDPFGRWIAVVESVYIKQTETIGSNLIVRNSVDGSVLLQRAFNSEIRIKASQDGEVIYAIASGQPASHRYTRITWDYKGGGDVVEVGLSEAIKGLARDSVVAWPATRCQIEDETINARSVAIDNRSRPLLFEHSLKPAMVNAQAFAGANRCTGDQPPEFGVVSWGGNGKKLWIDRNTSLEQISLKDGRVEKKIPTPRTSSRCAIPVFDREEYVVWEGDTISLLPFDGEREAKILVKKKGWFALSVEWFGNRFGVRWINHGGDVEEDFELECDAGSCVDVIATLYDVSGKQLQKVGGSLTNGNETFFPGEEEGVEPFDFRGGDLPGTRANLSSHYEWMPSYAGSVRAKYFDAKGNSKTVFWDGFDAFNPLTCNTDSNLAGGVISALGGGMGIKIQPMAITLFDAERRLRISGFSVDNPVQAEWFPDNHVLVVAEYYRNYGMNTVENPLLRAYLVNTTTTSPKKYCELIGQEYHVPGDYQPPRVDDTGGNSGDAANPSESNNSLVMEKSKVTNQKSEGNDWKNSFQVYWKIVEPWIYVFVLLVLVIAGGFMRRKQKMKC